jgi:hypothetical protein
MKTKLVVALLLAGSSLFAETHFSIGINLGGYGYAAPPVVAYAPPCPGPDYTWVDGYWDQIGPRRFWRDGYWAAPVYRSGFQAVSPFDRDRYEGGRYGGDRDDRRTYGNSFNGDRNHFTETRGQNSFNANRDQNRFYGNRDNGGVTTRSVGMGNRDGNQFNNGFGRR